MSDSLKVRGDLIQALISIVSRGIQDGYLDESERLLAALKILSPGLDAINEFFPYIAIKRGRVREALQMYSEAPSEDCKWYAMMALCLRMVNDPNWHWHATKAFDMEDATANHAKDLARILLGKEEDTPVNENISKGGEEVPVEMNSYINYISV